MNNATILTVPQICQMLTISEPTLRRYVNNNPDFPRRLHLGPRRVGFLKSDVDAYISTRLEAANRIICK